MQGQGAQWKCNPTSGATSDENMGTHSSVTETPLPKHSFSGGTLLTLCFPKTTQKMDFSRPREQGCARGAGLAPVDVSSAVYPLLSHKSGILLPTPPLPSDQDPKNHHFLLACELLINSRQKGLIRKLFGKWKGRGRDGELATAGASGWFYPSASPPRAAGGSLPWAPQICSSHAPNPVWLQDGSPSLSLCKKIWG